ncbi:hypothetical protein CLF_103645 [Clonorchis sinensis]|uniref:Uncharacterized protein n=1 Tax=Clonorchis sinensis TaxID=79923 RepID=G7YA40_CLOSI|nr:hypothetical protein CLF_103645 [Clonorchis sinensis]
MCFTESQQLGVWFAEQQGEDPGKLDLVNCLRAHENRRIITACSVDLSHSIIYCKFPENFQSSSDRDVENLRSLWSSLNCEASGSDKGESIAIIDALKASDTTANTRLESGNPPKKDYTNCKNTETRCQGVPGRTKKARIETGNVWKQNEEEFKMLLEVGFGIPVFETNVVQLTRICPNGPFEGSYTGLGEPTRYERLMKIKTNAQMKGFMECQQTNRSGTCRLLLGEQGEEDSTSMYYVCQGSIDRLEDNDGIGNFVAMYVTMLLVEGSLLQSQQNGVNLAVPGHQ